MGDGDLACATDEDLHASVAKIKQGQDEFASLAQLQLEFMKAHEQLAPGVFRTAFSDGTETVTNDGEREYICKGQTVQPRATGYFYG